MKKELKTTVWLDLLTYIILPFVMILGTISIIKGLLYGVFSLDFFISFLFEIIILSFYGYTFYHSYKRNKMAYNLFRILIVFTAIQAGLDFANTRNINNGDNFVIMFIVYLLIAGIVWVYPNEIYFKNRKHLFENASEFRLIFKCKKCNKIYFNKKSCSKCNK